MLVATVPVIGRSAWRLLFIGLVAIAPLSAVAHPSVGIVEDSAGNVFYTDLEKVWRIDMTPSATSTPRARAFSRTTAPCGAGRRPVLGRSPC
jgi:hypothetical protein